ncbi:MAG TPA: serine/threonine-protein kinase [Kofleriaceae bacterium]
MRRAMRYRVLEKIAHGGMAEIFLALQRGAEGFEKPVVLKRILPALAADPKFVRMIVDEAHIASTLNHSNLVQVLDLGRSTDDQYFLVLEFVDGWSLEQVRQRARRSRMKVPLPVALYVTGAVCRALAYVHTRTRDGKPLDIVHRDVSPQNVLVSREGDVKLADFGIAKAADRRERSATGVIKGKFAYMSPEQAIGADLDARSDLFSVGTLLYVLTTGKKPFDGPNDLEVLMKVRKARFDRPSTLVKDFNEDVERFIVRALNSARSKRWQTAEQMANRIDALMVKLGIQGGPGALKRWLETLATKDGLAPPAVRAAPAAAGTVEVGTEDLELIEVDTGAGTEEASAVDPPTHAASPRALPRGAEAEEGSAFEEVQVSRSPAREVARPAPAASPARARRRSTPSRLGRWLLRWSIGVVLLSAVLGVAAYFARPYLPTWAAEPIDSVLHRIHLD